MKEQENTFVAKVNDKFSFDLKTEDLSRLDIVKDGQENCFHILKDNTSFKVQVLSHDKQSKKMTLLINGSEFQVQLLDHYDLLIEKMGLNVSSSSKMNEVKSPMPGLVLDILVKEGDSFEKGDPLLILEAMKMENIIKATGEGTVLSIMTEKGKAVEKGEILIELD